MEGDPHLLHPGSGVQETPDCLWLHTLVPLSPGSPSRLADLTRDILGRDFLMVADKEWYCGQLIQELHAQLRCGPDPRQSRRPHARRSLMLSPGAVLTRPSGQRGGVYTTMTDFRRPVADALEEAGAMVRTSR